MFKGTGQEHRRCRGQEETSHAVPCFAGTEAVMGAQQWVGSAWPLHASYSLVPRSCFFLFFSILPNICFVNNSRCTVIYLQR